jgi:hypothetical protein
MHFTGAHACPTKRRKTPAKTLAVSDPERNIFSRLEGR